MTHSSDSDAVPAPRPATVTGVERAGDAPTSEGASARDEQDTHRLTQTIVDLLGGYEVLQQAPASPIDMHELILGGLPYASLFEVSKHLSALAASDISTAVGVSERTLRRQKDNPDKAMPTELASKTWQLAQTLAIATDVFGSQEAAGQWMVQAATGLDGRRPIDLLQTVPGAELVNDFLGRLEYGVFT